MYQNYVVEITKNAQGEMEHTVTWHWDENADMAMLKAKSKYHEVLSRAAVSEFAEHAAILFTSQGFPVLNECFTHEAAPSEETPEDAPVEE